jgi:hypothetical protein
VDRSTALQRLLPARKSERGWIDSWLRWRVKYISFASGSVDYPLFQILCASGGRKAFWRTPNGRMLIVDTASTAEGGGIVRVLLQDFHGVIQLDRYVAPGRAFPKRTMKASRTKMQELHEAPSLPQIWPSLLEALMGRYVVSYDLQRVRQALEEGAEEYRLEPPAVIGDCLRQHCLRYFHAAGFVGLESLCKLIGFPLPEPPNCTAIDRARGQLHLLQAMAQGITSESRELSTLRERDDGIPDDL